MSQPSSAGQHLAQARDNEAVLRGLSLNEASSRQWAVIISFFAALHYAEAYICARRIPRYGLRGESWHQFRSRIVATYIPHASPSYDRLWRESENGRYYLKRFSAAEVQQIHLDLDIVRSATLPLVP